MYDPQSPDPGATTPRPPQLKPGTLLLGFGLLGMTVFIAAAFLLAYLFQLAQTTETTLIIGGDTRTVNTRAATVGEMLDTLNIAIEEGDQLSVSPETPVNEGMVILLDRARRVILTINGQPRTLRTTLTNPADILANSGVTLAADDRVIVDGTVTDPTNLEDWPVPVSQIQIQRAVAVRIEDSGQVQTLRTARENVGEVLHDAGITLYLADAVEPDLNTPIEPDMTITIERSIPATIIADGVTIETRTRGGTVGDLLADADVALMGLDYSIPPEDTPMQPGISVRVIRVSEEVLIETELIPFENINQPDPALELDQIRLIQAGANGLRRRVTRVRYENGVEVSREVESDRVLNQPENRIVAYGTGIVLRTVETEQGPREYWRKIRMLTTSYHPAALGGDDITATGRRLTKGIVGVDPTVIPYGTEVYVPGYGIGVAADTGGPRSTRLWIDLGYDDENFIPWSQYSDVYILGPPPDNIQYVLPD